MSDKKSINVKNQMELKQAITYLEDVIKSLKKGMLVVQKGNEFVTLKPQENVLLEIKAEEKKGKEKLEFALSYEKEVVQASPAEIKISSEEPVVEEVQEPVTV